MYISDIGELCYGMPNISNVSKIQDSNEIMKEKKIFSY